MSSRWTKKDAYGQVLHPGDVCAAIVNDKIALVVYKEDSWGGKDSKGEYGRFLHSGTKRTLKYSSVIFAFDPMGKRRSMAEVIQRSIRQYYEGEK